MKTNRTQKVGTGLILLAWVCFMPSDANARVRPGVELGVNFSTSSIDDQEVVTTLGWDVGWRNSFTGGGTLEIPIRERLAFATGLRYVQQGHRVVLGPGSFGFPEAREFRLIQQYISIPLLLEARPLPSRNVLFSLGPDVMVLLSGEGQTDWTVPGLDESTDYTKNLEPVMLTLDVGLGFELPFENHVATMGIRYTHGVTGAAKEKDWASGWKTRGVEALLGFRW